MRGTACAVMNAANETAVELFLNRKIRFCQIYEYVRSAVEALKQDGIPVTVDLTGLAAGSYSCQLRFPTENYPDVSFEPETPALTVTLSETTAE